MTITGDFDLYEPGALDDEIPDEPGAMKVRAKRLLAGGLVEYEQAPAGWPAKNGEPRKREWRRYYWTPLIGDAFADKRETMPSVTTVCGDVIPKPGLPVWYERHGIIGAVEAWRQGLWDRHTDPLDVVRIVHEHELGGDAARDKAAGRGINVHKILEQYMRSGDIPNPADHPADHRPFIQGLARWLIAMQPEPLAVEEIVCDPERGYAGRLDLIAQINRRRVLVDLKTQEIGRIYDSAHLQVQLLKQAEERFGEWGPIDDLLLVAVDARGGYHELPCLARAEIAEHALAFYHEIKPVVSECDARNRALGLEASMG